MRKTSKIKQNKTKKSKKNYVSIHGPISNLRTMGDRVCNSVLNHIKKI